MTLGTRRISQKRSEISPVPTKAVTPPLNSDNEDNKSGLTCAQNAAIPVEGVDGDR